MDAGRRRFLHSVTSLVGGAVTAGALGSLASALERRNLPNVLFVAVDDMRDWTSGLGGYRGTVHTPNLDRLASMGVEFTNAHCPSPQCGPSRAAVMTGRMPWNIGIYGNVEWWFPHVPEYETLPVHFRNHGYRTVGSGKVHHHTAGFNPPYQWDKYKHLLFTDAPWNNTTTLNYPWSEYTAPPDGYPFSGVEMPLPQMDWGVLPGRYEREYDDSIMADFAVRYLDSGHAAANRRSGREAPFFLACGIYRPHIPWYAPQRYFDLYPLEDIVLPEVPDDELAGVPEEGRQLSRRRRGDFERIKRAGKWKEAVRAYLASVSFADAQLGRLLDALERSPYRDNTIVVFWSDHGFHLGEKNHWHKWTLWEESTRVPLLIAAPGMFEGGRKCDAAVSTGDIFPTLNELCRLPLPRQTLDGRSLVPLLNDPDSTWTHPAVMVFERGQCAVRSRRWRYIQYADGSEELYDHDSDPNEWKNLAARSGREDIIAEHKQSAPDRWAESAPGKDAYDFNPSTHVWTEKATGRRFDGTTGEYDA